MSANTIIRDTAKIQAGENTVELPVHVGTYDEHAIDISKFRGSTGYITLDVGFKNTGSTESTITFIDGEKGILEHRGYRIEDLANEASFYEITYLLWKGKLPNEAELNSFKADLAGQLGLPDGIKTLLMALPQDAHPMSMLSTLLSALPGFFPQVLDSWTDEDNRWETVYRIFANMPVLSAWIFRRSQGKDFIDPDPSLGYIENFLHMAFGEVDPVLAETLDTLLILHADHEQNCSASTVRFVGSSQVNLYAALAAGNCALWGPLHGGANQAVLEMLEAIDKDGGDTSKFLAKAKDKNDPFRLMGFGHRVYKNYDPRAMVIKEYADRVLTKLNIQDPILDIAKALEEAALQDDYFVQRKLFPNVDFYSGIIYRALGIPVEMFTVMFALGRLPGWIAQWMEMRTNKEPIGRPRQVYTGESTRDFTPIEKR